MAQHYIHPTATLGELPDTQLNSLVNSLSQLTLENDLRRKVLQNIARLRDMGSYRGRRHAMGLPVRGQRTRTQVGYAEAVQMCNRLTLYRSQLLGYSTEWSVGAEHTISLFI